MGYNYTRNPSNEFMKGSFFSCFVNLLTSKLAPLQTSESTSEVDPEKVTRVWMLQLPACIASHGSTMGSGNKHLVIVRTFRVSTLSTIPRLGVKGGAKHTSKAAGSDIQRTRENYLKVKLAILGKTHNSGSSPTATLDMIQLPEIIYKGSYRALQTPPSSSTHKPSQYVFSGNPFSIASTKSRRFFSSPSL